MDKTTKRVIGYKKPTAAANVGKPKVEKAPLEVLEYPKPKESKPVSSTADLVESFTAKLQQQQKEYDANLEAFVAKVAKLKEEVRSLKEGPKQEPATAREVISWIKDHPMFKYAHLCDEIGFDKGQFCKILKAENPSLKPEMVAKIQAVIKEYGFRPK